MRIVAKYPGLTARTQVRAFCASSGLSGLEKRPTMFVPLSGKLEVTPAETTPGSAAILASICWAKSRRRASSLYDSVPSETCATRTLSGLKP